VSATSNNEVQPKSILINYTKLLYYEICISAITPVALFSLFNETEDRRRLPAGRQAGKAETPNYQFGTNYILVSTDY